MEAGSEHATWTILALIAICCGAILLQIRRARHGRELYVRRLPGLEAVDDAVGRATEMGRPIMFCAGLGGIDIITLTSLAVGQYVAKEAAKFGGRTILPVDGVQLFPVAREVLREAYIAGSEDGVASPDLADVRYYPGGQFAWAMAVAGTILREKCAANFFFGSYGAEALMLAEAGLMADSVQVAATPSEHQIPFFLVTCDYTLFGEEFYAAGAYISREPVMLGSLVGQDIGKIVFLAIVLLGAILAGVDAAVAQHFPGAGSPLEWYENLLRR